MGANTIRTEKSHRAAEASRVGDVMCVHLLVVGGDADVHGVSRAGVSKHGGPLLALQEGGSDELPRRRSLREKVGEIKEMVENITSDTKTQRRTEEMNRTQALHSTAAKNAQTRVFSRVYSYCTLG